MGKRDEARKRATRQLRSLYRRWMVHEERGRRLVKEGRKRVDLFLAEGKKLIRGFARDGRRLLHDLKTRLRRPAKPPI